VENALRSLARSTVEMKAAISSSSVRALPELPGVPDACSGASWPDFSLLLLLPRPLLVALSPARLLWEVLVHRLRPAKLLLYRCTGAGLGDVDPDDAMAVSWVIPPGLRSAC
jgi:hypothetical protein